MTNQALDNLNQAIEKLNSLSESASERTIWRHMYSAPKDGTAVLGYKDGVMATMRWLHEERIWAVWVPFEIHLYHDFKPQFWMPLPPGPSERKYQRKSKGE